MTGTAIWWVTEPDYFHLITKYENGTCGYLGRVPYDEVTSVESHMTLHAVNIS